MKATRWEQGCQDIRDQVGTCELSFSSKYHYIYRKKFNKKLFNNDDVYGNIADLFVLVCTEAAEEKSQEEDWGQATKAEVANLPENMLQKKEKVKKTFWIL